jgi:5-methylcytosine-specific restriction protein B
MSEQPRDSQSRRIPDARIAEFFRAACEYLKECGGAAKKSQVMDAIRPRLNLTPEELSSNASGQERWDAATGYGFIAFQKAGYLKRGGGTWRLLDAGRAAMESMTAMEMLDAAHEKYAEWDAAREEEWDDDENVTTASRAKVGPRLWLIGTGENSERWAQFRAKGEIAIGFTYKGEQVGDLSTMSRAQIHGRVKELSGSRNPKNDSRACWEFAHSIREGELVVARAGNSRLLALGRIVGPYTFDKAAPDYAHVRRVDWFDVHDRAMPDRVQLPTKTLTEMSQYPDIVDLILGSQTAAATRCMEERGHDEGSIEAFFRQQPFDVAAFGVAPASTAEPSFDPAEEEHSMLQAIESDSFAPRSDIEAILAAIATKRAVVLQGSPGTGKTFLAQRLAQHVAGAAERVHRVQFHPSYSYEDFVRGIRPTKDGFAVANGPLVRIADAARRSKDDKFVLFIDEFNRGNVAKILGEALSLIEADKRGSKHSVKLSLEYDGSTDFWIPENVYVLATMNTADRSIALVDYALRRRFAFIRLVPAYDKPVFFDTMLAQFAPGADEGASATERGRRVARTIVDAMRSINDLIIADKSFGEDFAIGHSFFCTFDPGRGEAVEAWATRVFEREIRPLIDEYCVEHPALRRKLLELIPSF